MTSFASVMIPYMDKILSFFQIEMQIYEFTFSFWDIFLFTVAATCVVAFIGGLLE